MQSHLSQRSWLFSSLACSCLATSALLIGSQAWAQEPGLDEIRNDVDAQNLAELPPEYDKQSWPVAVVERPLTLDAGMVEIRGRTVVVDLSDGSVAEPVSLAPSVYFGITDELEVGITHRLPLPHSVGAGICVTGDDGGCRAAYNNVGLDGLWRFVRSNHVEVAARLGVEVPAFDVAPDDDGEDSLLLGLRLGVAAKLHSGNFGLVFEPSVYVGLGNRELGNEEFIEFPLLVQYQISPVFEAHLITGVNGPAEDFADFNNVPLGAGVTYTVGRSVDVGADFVFPNLLGPNYFNELASSIGVGMEEIDRADFRQLVIRLAARF